MRNKYIFRFKGRNNQKLKNEDTKHTLGKDKPDISSYLQCGEHNVSNEKK